MIRVTPQPEPENFDRDVRQKGRKKLEELQIDATSPLPPKTKLPNLCPNFESVIVFALIRTLSARPAKATSTTLSRKVNIPLLPTSGRTIVLPCPLLTDEKKTMKTFSTRLKLKTRGSNWRR